MAWGWQGGIQRRAAAPWCPPGSCSVLGGGGALGGALSLPARPPEQINSLN